MSDTPARGAGVSEKSLPEPYEVWRPNRIRWSKNRGAYQEVTHTAFACLPGGDLGGDTIIATDRNKCATQLSVADAWAITAAISPRPTVRVAAVNEDGSTLNSYPPQYITPVTAAAADQAQPATLRHRGCQPATRYVAHRGQDDRVVDAEQFGERGVQGHDFTV